MFGDFWRKIKLVFFNTTVLNKLNAILNFLGEIVSQGAKIMAGIEALKAAVSDVEASNLDLETRVAAFEKSQADANAALQAEIDALKTSTGLSDVDAQALATRLEAVKSGMDTVNSASPASPVSNISSPDTSVKA